MGNQSYATCTHTTVAVASADTAVLTANAAALYRIFINDGALPLYLGLGVAAVANKGIRVNANGGNYEMAAALGNLYTGAVNAIHSSTGTVAILVTQGVQ